ncbi:MAG: hypothetical protein WC942_08375 [Clostridia bacterium]|jgi:hypothetical protein
MLNKTIVKLCKEAFIDGWSTIGDAPENEAWASSDIRKKLRSIELQYKDHASTLDDIIKEIAEWLNTPSGEPWPMWMHKLVCLLENINYNDGEITHVGHLIKEEMNERHWDYDKLSKETQLDQLTLKEVIEDGLINDVIAERLGKAFGTSTELWINLSE